MLWEFFGKSEEGEEWRRQQGGVSKAIAIAMAMDLTRTLSFLRHSTNACTGAGILAANSASGAIFACTGLIPLRLDLERRVRRKFNQSGSKFSGKLVYSNQNGSVRAKIANTNSSSSSSSSSDPTSSSPKEKEKQQSILDLPAAIWKQILGPLSNFGFGKRSVWEGGVGLFVMSGVVLLAITLVWVKGKQIRARTRKYEAIFEFQQAQGITVGTPVRIRGVDVGNVVQVRPSLERIDVVVELSDAGIVVPRNALVEVNQSGLISETLIDVTPRKPLPKPTVGPMDPKCAAEGLIVCDRERIKGEQGVSLDELVGICTKIARQVDALGVDRVVGMAERLGDAVQEARPLLAKVNLTLLNSFILLSAERWFFNLHTSEHVNLTLRANFLKSRMFGRWMDGSNGGSESGR